MGRDPTTHFATIACSCTAWTLSVGVLSPGAPKAVVSLQCWGCSDFVTMTLEKPAPREGLLGVIALASRHFSREELHEMVDEALVKGVMEA
jgi:hypothetical protein